MQVVRERLLMAVSGVSHVQERRNNYVTLHITDVRSCRLKEAGAETLLSLVTLGPQSSSAVRLASGRVA